MTVKRNILLNPGPATTSKTVKEALIVPDICPREAEFGEILMKICQTLPKVVHGDNEYVAVLFASSGTGGLEAAISSAIPTYGKLLVVENGAYGRRMYEIAKTYNIPCINYQLEYGAYPKLKEIEHLLNKDPTVTHLAVVHHETTTGMLNPVEKICRLAQKFEVEVIVDAISSFAGIPIGLREWGAGFLVSSSNKCLQGMPGLSFVIVRQDLLPKLQFNRRSYYFDIYSQYHGFNRTRQMPFTPPVQLVYALRQALVEYFNETEAGRWDRYRTNWEILYQGLNRLCFKFLLPLEQQSKILLAILDPVDKQYSFQHMHDYLYQRGFTIYPGKGAKKNTFRLAILGDLYPPDIEQFLVALKKYIDHTNLKIA